MKIGINLTGFLPGHGGGKDQVGYNLLEGFANRGFARDIHIYCLDDVVDQIRAKIPGAEFTTYPGRYADKDFLRSAYVLYINSFSFRKAVCRDKPDVLFFESSNTGLFRVGVIPSIVLPFDIKAVSHRVLGQTRTPLYKHLIYRFMYLRDFRTNDRIIAMCRFDESQIHTFYPFTKGKTSIIHCPIRIQSDEAFFLPTVGTEYITAINLQFHHKNIITLLRAYESIMNAVPQNLMLIGNVPQRVEYLREYVRERPAMRDRVVFAGFVPSEEKDDILRRTALYVNPTLYEGFGMTAVEAMIAGVPCLISDVAANREVTLGRATYYEPADSPDALAKKILEQLENQPSKPFREESRRLLIEKYHYQRIADEYLQIFASVANERKNSL